MEPKHSGLPIVRVMRAPWAWAESNHCAANHTPLLAPQGTSPGKGFSR
jgi:hypothetical protein